MCHRFRESVIVSVSLRLKHTRAPTCTHSKTFINRKTSFMHLHHILWKKKKIGSRKLTLTPTITNIFVWSHISLLTVFSSSAHLSFVGFTPTVLTALSASASKGADSCLCGSKWALGPSAPGLLLNQGWTVGECLPERKKKRKEKKRATRQAGGSAFRQTNKTNPRSNFAALTDENKPHLGLLC